MSRLTLRSALVALGFKDCGFYVAKQCRWDETVDNSEGGVVNTVADMVVLLNPEENENYPGRLWHLWRDNQGTRGLHKLCWSWSWGWPRQPKEPLDIYIIALAGAIINIPNCYHGKRRVVQWTKNERGLVDEAVRRVEATRRSSVANGS